MDTTDLARGTIDLEVGSSVSASSGISLEHVADDQLDLVKEAILRSVKN